MRDFDECRAYLWHLTAEHQQLGDAERTAASAVDAWRRQAGHPETRAAARAAVASFVEVLEEHFTEEEAGGCLEEAISVCPHVSREADELLREHAELDRQARALLAAFAEPSSGAVARVEQLFHRLTGTLHRHEEAEDRVLETAFGGHVDDAQGAPPLRANESE